MEQTNSKLDALMGELNQELKKYGMLEMAVVDPNDCLPQKVNARYFTPEMFDQLVQNVKGTGALESTPLVYQNEELKAKGKYEIISGHHRVDAAKAAKLPKIMVMVMRDIDRDGLVSRQLSHNAITGVDDQTILKKLFDGIKSVDAKLATGLKDEIQKIEYESLNFKLGKVKSFVVLFGPEDIAEYDEQMRMFFDNATIAGDAEVRIAAIDTHPEFVNCIMRIKKIENIKSNAVAMMRIIQLAKGALDNIENGDLREALTEMGKNNIHLDSQNN